MNIGKDLVAASAVLLLLAILKEQDSYGYAIIKRVKELSGNELVWTEGMLYPVLHRLEKHEALASLKKALDIAMPDKQYMLFVENRDYIEPLLEKISAEGSYREDIDRILELYETFKGSKEQMIKAYFTEEKPKLTQREMEIARLAAVGMTNIEIGRQLFISPNTVKMALKSIYAKLSINNRALLQQHFSDLG